MDHKDPTLYALPPARIRSTISTMASDRVSPVLEHLSVQNVGVARLLLLNRPERRNALTPELARELSTQIHTVTGDPSVRAILLRGAGGHFSVGLDLAWYAELGDSVSDELLEDGLAAFQDVVRAIVDCPLPVVAVLEGSVAGFGLDMALACDMRLASTTVSITSAFARVGLIPDGGSTAMLPRLVGVGNAMDILVAGKTVDAERAQAIGLVTAVYPEDRVEAEAITLAEGLAAQPRSSLTRIKQLVRRADRELLEVHLQLEARAQLEALKSQEFVTRLKAFVRRTEA